MVTAHIAGAIATYPTCFWRRGCKRSETGLSADRSVTCRPIQRLREMTPLSEQHCVYKPCGRGPRGPSGRKQRDRESRWAAGFQTFSAAHFEAREILTK